MLSYVQSPSPSQPQRHIHIVRSSERANQRYCTLDGTVQSQTLIPQPQTWNIPCIKFAGREVIYPCSPGPNPNPKSAAMWSDNLSMHSSDACFLMRLRKPEPSTTSNSKARQGQRAPLWTSVNAPAVAGISNFLSGKPSSAPQYHIG